MTTTLNINSEWSTQCNASGIKQDGFLNHDGKLDGSGYSNFYVYRALYSDQGVEKSDGYLVIPTQKQTIIKPSDLYIELFGEKVPIKYNTISAVIIRNLGSPMKLEIHDPEAESSITLRNDGLYVCKMWTRFNVSEDTVWEANAIMPKDPEVRHNVAFRVFIFGNLVM